MTNTHIYTDKRNKEGFISIYTDTAIFISRVLYYEG